MKKKYSSKQVFLSIYMSKLRQNDKLDFQKSGS